VKRNRVEAAFQRILSAMRAVAEEFRLTPAEHWAVLLLVRRQADAEVVSWDNHVEVRGHGEGV
jgi:hypothetical protein